MSDNNLREEEDLSVRVDPSMQLGGPLLPEMSSDRQLGLAQETNGNSNNFDRPVTDTAVFNNDRNRMSD